jgi:hypothetical protein
MSHQRSNDATDRSESHSSSLAGDLLHGADAIALFVFGHVKHRRKIYHYASDARVRMPVFRIGAALCARKSTLLRWIAEQESRG